MYVFLTVNIVHAYTCLLYTVDFDIPDTDLIIKKKPIRLILTVQWRKMPRKQKLK